jgi:hypothetical protein
MSPMPDEIRSPFIAGTCRNGPGQPKGWDINLACQCLIVPALLVIGETGTTRYDRRNNGAFLVSTPEEANQTT